MIRLPSLKTFATAAALTSTVLASVATSPPDDDGRVFEPPFGFDASDSVGGSFELTNVGSTTIIPLTLHVKSTVALDPGRRIVVSFHRDDSGFLGGIDAQMHRLTDPTVAADLGFAFDSTAESTLTLTGAEGLLEACGAGPCDVTEQLEVDFALAERSEADGDGPLLLRWTARAGADDNDFSSAAASGSIDLELTAGRTRIEAPASGEGEAEGEGAGEGEEGGDGGEGEEG